jgi:hypothetical protein
MNPTNTRRSIVDNNLIHLRGIPSRAATYRYITERLLAQTGTEDIDVRFHDGQAYLCTTCELADIKRASGSSISSVYDHLNYLTWNGYIIREWCEQRGAPVIVSAPEFKVTVYEDRQSG